MSGAAPRGVLGNQRLASRNGVCSETWRMDERRTTHDLVPLELAARTIYQRVYEEQHRKTGRACGVDELNGIAYAIISLVPIFTYDKDPQALRQLSNDEVLKGLLRDGGRTMIFVDGRATIPNLAVSTTELERVASLLRTRGARPD